MKTANAGVIDVIFTVVQIVTFDDPECLYDRNLSRQEDVEWFAQSFLAPSLASAASAGVSLIHDSLSYYSKWGTPPFDAMWNDLQEIEIERPDDWRRFIMTVGRTLFGNNFSSPDSDKGWNEKHDFEQAQAAFRDARCR